MKIFHEEMMIKNQQMLLNSQDLNQSIMEKFLKHNLLIFLTILYYHLEIEPIKPIVHMFWIGGLIEIILKLLKQNKFLKKLQLNSKILWFNCEKKFQTIQILVNLTNKHLLEDLNHLRREIYLARENTLTKKR
jgi:hypothetical protein